DRSLRVTFPDPAEQQQVIGEFNAARDYLAAPNGPTARSAVQDAAADLAAFEQAALASEAPEPGVNRSTPAARRRGDRRGGVGSASRHRPPPSGSPACP